MAEGLLSHTVADPSASDPDGSPPSLPTPHQQLGIKVIVLPLY